MPQSSCMPSNIFGRWPLIYPCVWIAPWLIVGKTGRVLFRFTCWHNHSLNTYIVIVCMLWFSHLAFTMMESMLNPQDLHGQTSVQKRCLGKKLYLSYQRLKDLLPSRPLLVDMEIWGTEVRVMYTTLCFRNLHKTLTLKRSYGNKRFQQLFRAWCPTPPYEYRGTVYCIDVVCDIQTCLVEVISTSCNDMCSVCVHCIQWSF